MEEISSETEFQYLLKTSRRKQQEAGLMVGEKLWIISVSTCGCCEVFTLTCHCCCIMCVCLSVQGCMCVLRDREKRDRER